MSKKDRDVLSDAISRMIDINSGSVSIAPDTIADGAMKIIGADYDNNNALWYAGYQHMLQLARAQLRGRFDQAGQSDGLYLAEQIEMGFGDALQDRYPKLRLRTPDGTYEEPQYVLRGYLSEDDCWHNIDRLDHRSIATTRHSRALRAETIARFGPRKGVA
jgi:hypothetical protein